MESVAAEEVAGVDFGDDVIEGGIIAIGNDAIAYFFEFFQVVDDFAAEEGAAGFEGWFVDDDGGAFGFDA